jgi:hypothetical protein
VSYREANAVFFDVCHLFCLGATSVAKAEEAKGGLFVNLTTDDTWVAAKAIAFAHE